LAFAHPIDASAMLNGRLLRLSGAGLHVRSTIINWSHRRPSILKLTKDCFPPIPAI
jgi:hypothetical protein